MEGGNRSTSSGRSGEKLAVDFKIDKAINQYMNSFKLKFYLDIEVEKVILPSLFVSKSESMNLVICWVMHKKPSGLLEQRSNQSQFNSDSHSAKFRYKF